MMAVADTGTASTFYDVPLVVVANGIPSAPITVNIQ
jgi:hypothetical protein